MATFIWEHYPQVCQLAQAKTWLSIQSNLGQASNTLIAYAYGLEDFLVFCAKANFTPNKINREQISLYVRDLIERPKQGLPQLQITVTSTDNNIPRLANATLQLRLTAVRLYFDYLMEENLRSDNPVGRGRYTPGKSFGSKGERGLIPRYRKQPWIPAQSQWHSILEAARTEPIRNRMMLALAYDAALRREELCALQTGDLDPSLRLIHIRAETTKNRQSRTLPYSPTTNTLYAAYLKHRRELSRERGPLFLSDSPRNRAKPISIWAWSKVIRSLALRAGVPQFSTHTPRHLCLTDLALAGWDIHEIARFAGHRSLDTTLLYIHLSGRDLADKLAGAMGEIHRTRLALLAEELI